MFCLRRVYSAEFSRLASGKCVSSAVFLCQSNVDHFHINGSVHQGTGVHYSLLRSYPRNGDLFEKNRYTKGGSESVITETMESVGALNELGEAFLHKVSTRRTPNPKENPSKKILSEGTILSNLVQDVSLEESEHADR